MYHVFTSMVLGCSCSYVEHTRSTRCTTALLTDTHSMSYWSCSSVAARICFAAVISFSFFLFFSLGHRSRGSLGGASRHFGKRLEAGVILEC